MPTDPAGPRPRNVSSGERQATAGLIEACDRQLRSTLIEAAQRLKRYDPYWREFATKMVERGKPANLATAAVANRWLRKLHHEMKPLGLGC